MFEGIFWYATWVEVILVGSTDIKFPDVGASSYGGATTRARRQIIFNSFALNSSLMLFLHGNRRTGYYAERVNYYVQPIG